jgi:putative oxidoreductase
METRTFWDEWSQRALSVLRIVIALLFIEHGTQKLIGFPSGLPGGPVPVASLMGVAGLIETFGGLLLLLGFLTRPIAFIMSGEMAVAYFMAHAPHSPFPVVNKGEPAVLFCFIFLYYFFAGAGSWSLDAVIWKRRPANHARNAWSGQAQARG